MGALGVIRGYPVPIISDLIMRRKRHFLPGEKPLNGGRRDINLPHDRGEALEEKLRGYTPSIC